MANRIKGITVEIGGDTTGQLRKYLDESYNGEPKPAWYVYQKANTHEEDEFFEQFLPIIGISDWVLILQRQRKARALTPSSSDLVRRLS